MPLLWWRPRRRSSELGYEQMLRASAVAAARENMDLQLVGSVANAIQFAIQVMIKMGADMEDATVRQDRLYVSPRHYVGDTRLVCVVSAPGIRILLDPRDHFYSVEQSLRQPFYDRAHPNWEAMKEVCAVDQVVETLKQMPEVTGYSTLNSGSTCLV